MNRYILPLQSFTPNTNQKQNKIMDQFVTYGIAKMLKELNFAEPCIRVYGLNGDLHSIETVERKNSSEYLNVTAPTWWQVKEWLWEKHKIRIDIAGNLILGFCSASLDFKTKPAILVIETKVEHVDTPIIAEILALERAVKHLHLLKSIK